MFGNTTLYDLLRGHLQSVLFWRKASRFFFVFLFFFFGVCRPAFAQVISISDGSQSAVISSGLQQLIDSNKISTPAEAIHASFTKNNGRIPVFPNSVKSVWFTFTAGNHSNSGTLFLNIAYPNLSQVSLYTVDSSAAEPVLIGKEGNEIISTQHIAASPNLVFNLRLKPGATQHYLLHVYSEHPIIVPGEIHTYDSIHQSINVQTIVTGLYLGILLVMFLYNLFLFFVTKDNSYVYYIVYILFLALAQTTVAGYEYRYLWPGSPALNKYAVVITSSLSAISGLIFSMHFLRTYEYAKRMHRWLQILAGIYIAGLVCCMFSLLSISYNILNFNGLVSVISVLTTCVIIAKRGFRPAYFYLTAWLLLLVSFIILILRNISVLPYNNFTTYVIYVGSAIEVALLSIALADKITVLRKEKEASQAEALEASLETERLVRTQNVMLEKKVAERTEELQTTNDNLNTTLQDLKDTQIQLVEAEKMASLGQLTAGIAHEINNPINFVKSNIKPLQLDIKDLIEIIDAYDTLHTTAGTEIPAKLEQINKLKKQIDIGYVRNEIDNLVKGIQDGAERTAEIVMGLRNFSRLDESEVKTVDVHEGINSTLILLKNTLPENIVIKKDFKSNGLIECFPGKLNQVFMNILSNGIQAIKEKEVQEPEESVTISTMDVDDKIVISLKDTGVGMTDEVRQKIFDPFFTTKDVGEGTGLGLSIVYKIIQKHAGKIEVVSAKGKGAEFIISLYKVLPESAFS
jgi:two-component system NtrC family sensor kinase